LRIDMVSEHASPLAHVGRPDSGGQNVHVAALAVALSGRDHDVAVLTRRDDVDEPETVVFAPGVTVEQVPAALEGARGGAFPVVQTFHALGSVERRYQKGAGTSPASRIRLEGQIARQADAIIATCTDEVTELGEYGAPPGNVSAVPWGVDTACFRPEGPPEERATRVRDRYTLARVTAETEAGYERPGVVASRPAVVADRA
jgi:D-inositol-3-phosphate glycosyltransferase